MERNEEYMKNLREDYNKACNAYVRALIEQWELGDYGFWVGEDVGGVFAYEELFLDMGEIIYCVDNKIPMEEVYEWQEYYAKCKEYGFNTINLKSWCMGAPRIPKEAFGRLDRLKEELNNEIERYKDGKTPY